MSLAKPYSLSVPVPGDAAAVAVQPPSPEGNRQVGPAYSEPEWRPGAGQNQLLTKSPTNRWPALVPPRSPFRVV